MMKHSVKVMLLSLFFGGLCLSSCSKEKASPSSSSLTNSSREEVSSTAAENPIKDDMIRKYVTLFFTNKRHEEVAAYLPEMEYLHGKIDENSDRMYAFGVVGPMLLTQSIEEMQEEVNACFDYAEEYGIPVYFQLDDINNYTSYFGSGAAEKFWENPEMCEWIAFPEEGEKYGGERKYGGLPRFWYNWGVWRSTKATPNLASPAFRALVTDNLKRGVLDPLMKRYNKLVSEGKGYLFAGLAVGWETHIPDYSSYNTFLGISAANLPINPGGEITLALNEETLAGGMSGILPEEEPLHEAMRAALEGFTRPEWDAEDAAEDLRFLAKQGVPLSDMAEVMGTMLSVQPTIAMHSALRRLHDSTPHWIGMTAHLKH